MIELKIIKEKYFQERKVNKGLLAEIILAVETILTKYKLDNIDYKKTETNLNYYYFKMVEGIFSSETVSGNEQVKDIFEEKNKIKNSICIKRFLTNEYSDNRVIEDLRNDIYKHNLDRLLGITNFRFVLKTELHQALLPIFNADLDNLLDEVFSLKGETKSETGMGKRKSKFIPGLANMEEVII